MRKKKIKTKEPTIKQKRAIELSVENGGNVSKAMRDAGYSPKTAKNPDKLTKSKAWGELMEEYLSDADLAKAHKELLGATLIEHMVFPTNITDDEIKELLSSVNCTIRKIQHSDQGNHCWFWARDNNALKNGLDLAYKLKGKYAPEKSEINLGVSLSEEQARQLIAARARRSNIKGISN